MILHENYYEDLLEYLRNTPDTVFWMGLRSRKEIMKDKKLLDRMWTEYQKQIELGVDANYAYAFTVEEVLGIPLQRWKNLFDLYIIEQHTEFYGHR